MYNAKARPANKSNSFARHRFPPSIIRHAVWLYCRFTLGFRDIEDLLAERGIDVSIRRSRAGLVNYKTTTGSKIRICRCDDESEKCSASSPSARPSASFPSTVQPTTASMSSVTSSPETPCASSETPPWRSGSLHPLSQREFPHIGPRALSGR